MRIAFDGRSLKSHALRGWDRYTIGLIRQLVMRGIEVALFYRSREPLNPKFVSNLGCEVIGLEDFGGLHWEQVAVPLALWRGKFDLFHAPAEHGVPLAAPCPVVLTIHSVTALSYMDLIRRGLLTGRVGDYLGSEPSRSGFWSLYWRAGVARVNHILTPSEFSRTEIVALLRVAENRVTVTPLAVDDQFRRLPSPANAREATLNRLGIRRPYLLYVGGYERHKNIAGLLESFSLVRECRPNLSLVLAGTNSLPQEVKEHAVHLGLDPGSVIFLLDVTDDLVDLYDAAELFLTLSWRETFSLTLLEAMSRGTPVLASRWGGAPSTIGAAGSLVDPRDLRGACAAILELLSGDRSELQERARLRAEGFTWSETVERTVKVYESLVGR